MPRHCRVQPSGHAAACVLLKITGHVSSSATRRPDLCKYRSWKGGEGSCIARYTHTSASSQREARVADSELCDNVRQHDPSPQREGEPLAVRAPCLSCYEANRPPDVLRVPSRMLAAMHKVMLTLCRPCCRCSACSSWHGFWSCWA